MRVFSTRFILALCALTLAPSIAIAAGPDDEALATLREMRVLNYRIQTRYHVGALAASDDMPFRHLKQDVQRFEQALGDLQAADTTARWKLPLDLLESRWEAVRWFATTDLPTPRPEILPREITYDRARRPASIAAMKIAGQQLAAVLVETMLAVPAPREPQSHIDFALAALELQYIAYRYVDLAGANPELDISGEPTLPILETAFHQRMAGLESRYGEDPAYAAPMRVLRASWLFIQPALSRAQSAPVPVLVSRYTSLATDALLPVYTGNLREPTPTPD